MPPYLKINAVNAVYGGCGCGPPSTSCPAGQVKGKGGVCAVTGECAPSSGQIWDEVAGECVCPDGQKWDATTGACVPFSVNGGTTTIPPCPAGLARQGAECLPCPSGYEPSKPSGATCVAIGCPEGQTWDDVVKACALPDRGQQCALGELFEAGVCKKRCAPDEDWIESLAQCKKKFCQAGYEYSIEEKKCVPVVPPPWIEELFPVGSEIKYIDGGVTEVVFPDKTSCTLSSDDIFVLLMLKEAFPDQDTVEYSGLSNQYSGDMEMWTGVKVTTKAGEKVEFSNEDLQFEVRQYHSFFDLTPMPFGVGNPIPQEQDNWQDDTPMGYQALSYANTAAVTKQFGVFGLYAAKGKGGIPLTNHPATAVAGELLRFINWDPNPEGRPGQGKAAFYDKCGNQITMAQAEARMTGRSSVSSGFLGLGGPEYNNSVEIVYKVDSFGGEPTVLNYEAGYAGQYPITDFGCYFGKMPPLKHPTPRTKNHPRSFVCAKASWNL